MGKNVRKNDNLNNIEFAKKFNYELMDEESGFLTFRHINTTGNGYMPLPSVEELERAMDARFENWRKISPNFVTNVKKLETQHPWNLFGSPVKRGFSAVTFAVEVDFQHFQLNCGFSVCGKEDNFSRKVGREIALKRLSDPESNFFLTSEYRRENTILGNVVNGLFTEVSNSNRDDETKHLFNIAALFIMIKFEKENMLSWRGLWGSL